MNVFYRLMPMFIFHITVLVHWILVYSFWHSVNFISFLGNFRHLPQAPHAPYIYKITIYIVPVSQKPCGNAQIRPKSGSIFTQQEAKPTAFHDIEDSLFWEGGRQKRWSWLSVLPACDRPRAADTKRARLLWISS